MPQPAALPARFGVIFHLLLNILFQVARNAVHPYDHRNDEEGRDQHQQAFEAIFIDVPVFQGDGHGQAERRGRGHAIPDEARKLRAASAGQINEDNADNQRSFDTFTESDKESREQRFSSC